MKEHIRLLWWRFIAFLRTAAAFSQLAIAQSSQNVPPNGGGGYGTGADRSWLHAGAVEIPIRMVQAVGDAVVLLFGVDGLQKVLPGASGSAPSP